LTLVLDIERGNRVDPHDLFIAKELRDLEFVALEDVFVVLTFVFGHSLNLDALIFTLIERDQVCDVIDFSKINSFLQDWLL